MRFILAGLLILAGCRSCRKVPDYSERQDGRDMTSPDGGPYSDAGFYAPHLDGGGK